MPRSALLFALALLPQSLVKPTQPCRLVGPQRSAIGPLCQSFQIEECRSLDSLERLLANGDARPNPLEEAVNQIVGRIRLLGLHFPIDELDAHFPQVDPLELRQERFLDQQRIVFAEEIETLVGQHVPLGAENSNQMKPRSSVS